MAFCIFFLAIIAGYFLSRYTNEDKVHLSHILLFGFGIFGIFCFSSILIWGNLNFYRTLIFYLLIIVILVLFLKRKRIKIFSFINFDFFDLPVLGIIFCVARLQPYGWWDAWSFWITKAKFLAFGGNNWNQIFSPFIQWMHPDYPLFYPSVLAGAWNFSSTNNFWVPIIVTVLFSWALYLLLKDAAVYLFKSKIIGIVSGMVLIFIPAFLRWGTSQYADIPLACYLLLSATLLFRYKTKLTFLLSGFSLGLVAFTKNEGMFYVLIFILSLILAHIFAKEKIKKINILNLLLGIIPGIVLLLIIKKSAPINNLFLLDFKNIAPDSWSRIFLIIKCLFKEFLKWKEWMFFWPISFGFYFIGLLTKNKKDYRIVFFSFFFAMSFLFYFVVYIFIPLKYDISWYIDTSFNRLLIQIAPFFIFYFLILIKNLIIFRKNFLEEKSQKKHLKY